MASNFRVTFRGDSQAIVLCKDHLGSLEDGTSLVYTDERCEWCEDEKWIKCRSAVENRTKAEEFADLCEYYQNMGLTGIGQVSEDGDWKWVVAGHNASHQFSVGFNESTQQFAHKAVGESLKVEHGAPLTERHVTVANNLQEVTSMYLGHW